MLSTIPLGPYSNQSSPFVIEDENTNNFRYSIILIRIFNNSNMQFQFSAAMNSTDLFCMEQVQAVHNTPQTDQLSLPSTTSTNPPAFIVEYECSSMPSSSSSSGCSDLYEIFPDIPPSTLDALFSLCSCSKTLTTDLVTSLSLEQVLSIFRQKVTDVYKQQKVQVDEGDILNDTIAIYKNDKLSLSHPIRVSFVGQPAVDSGGVRRQFFNDSIEKFAFSSDLNLFVGSPFRLRPRHSTQIIISGTMKIIGRLIAHAILLEGIGFPYLSPCLYWYMCTQSENIALQYALLDDLDEHCQAVVQQVGVCLVFNYTLLLSLDNA